ncbi:mitochondrial ribosomal protein subunit L20-domain-containing protein [Parachaetomium inaequale]|uniref:Mitochondrial ribosomal protein subunit L20-domain-containing protein n=1 Tax=Parachaetomium inaequale TaxID=2588326 RepID=A0AAN6SUL4_9PEZI|nr:mitochondrial ribosomal protein subunit L20-domain-containing protein [Parachaetomium inaequale]
MEAIATRPAVACCRRAASSAPASTRPILNTLPSGARQKSTAARTRRALNIPPHPSFLTQTGNNAEGRPTTDQIIYNPPSSAASVFHTPFKFLPKNDPRRRANLASELFASSATIHFNTNPSSTPSSSSTTAEEFPSIEGAPRYRARHHLAPADIEEMRRLREADPAQNTVQALSARFQCSKLFVMMCCQAPREHRDKVKADLAQTQERWGPRRRAAREERRARMGMVFGGEL